MIKHLDITVSGKVQGVGYRIACKANADILGVKGVVKNDANGDVLVEAEGDKLSLDLFLDWCREGPEHAEVKAVSVNEGELKNYRNFEVLRRGLFR